MGKKGNKFLLQQQNRDQIEWPESVRAPYFFFFHLSACWGYLCIYDFLEETRGLVLALCACQTEWETQQVCMWVSVLATRWADEVFWTEKDDFHQTWVGIHRQPVREFRSLKQKNHLRGFILWSHNILELLDFLGSTVSIDCVKLFSCSFFVFKSALQQYFLLFMCCSGCILTSGWTSSAGTGSLCSGRTGCSTRSQEKSLVLFPKPCSMKLKAIQSRKTQISRPRTWILRTKTLK